DLDEIQVALRRPAAVFRNDVVRDQIARLEGRLGRLRFGRLVGRVGLRLVELTAELRDAEAVAIEYGRGRAARTAALGTRGLTQLLEIKELVLRDRPAILAERHGHRPPLAAVDRVTQLDVLEAEVVARLDPQRDLLDVARARVAPGLRDLHDRLLVRYQVDEIVVRQANVRLIEQCRDEVFALLV